MAASSNRNAVPLPKIKTDTENHVWMVPMQPTAKRRNCQCRSWHEYKKVSGVLLAVIPIDHRVSLVCSLGRLAAVAMLDTDRDRVFLGDGATDRATANGKLMANFLRSLFSVLMLRSSFWRRSWRHRLARLAIIPLLAYCGILLGLLVLEDFFVFGPTSAWVSAAPRPGRPGRRADQPARQRIHAWWTEPDNWRPVTRGGSVLPRQRRQSVPPRR